MIFSATTQGQYKNLKICFHLLLNCNLIA